MASSGGSSAVRLSAAITSFFQIAGSIGFGWGPSKPWTDRGTAKQHNDTHQRQPALVCGHAYGGLYLTGGMIERLNEKGLFDFQSLEKYFVLDCVDSVKHDLGATKIALVKEPYLAMKGLCEALNA